MKTLRLAPLVLAGLGVLGAQTLRPTPSRLNVAIDNQVRAASHGNVPGQLRRATDLGPAPAALPLRRMILVLKHSPDQAAALAQLLADQQTEGSPRYHQWLTPAQYGAQFGPSDADMATVEAWLTAQGLTVDRVARGRGVIEFSGTPATVDSAFHTSMHAYTLDNVAHWSNASEPTIPAALSPVVAGVATLNNFEKPAGRVLYQGHGDLSTPGHPQPAFTFNNGAHAMVPGDFAMIYNVTPLYSASPAINGQGQAIAIVERSNINLQDVQDFRNLFVASNAGNLPTIVLNGPDPGNLGGGDEAEAALDVEWAGGIAPNATIDMVVSASTDVSDGTDLSTEYIVDNDLAPVMSESFSACEAGLGTSENQFIEAVDEQAAAEGITVVVSTGDSGAAACDPNDGSEAAATGGVAVSGLATTPFDTAVGGSQFNEGSGTYWSPTNDVLNHSSALSYIPETTWNESCLNAGCDPNGPLSATGGGTSTVYTTANGVGKPVWQQAPGVPNDGARDIPDVAFAAAGHDGYIVCVDGSCANGLAGSANFEVFGGTSASAPSFAAVMALINQKVSSTQGQGVANYNLYALARSSAQNYAQCNAATATGTSQASCIFNDVTTGNNSEPCAGGSPGCSAATGTGTLTGSSAGVGYDEVTGLGTMNVANLVNDWSGVTPALGTTTALTINPTSFAHGQAPTITVTVVPSSGSGLGPTGDVAILAQPVGGGAFQSIDFGTVTPGGCGSGTTPCVTGSEALFVGGTYNVVARYAGDANFAPSVSAPVQLSVSKEGSATGITVYEVNSSFQEIGVSSVHYGDPYFMQAVVAGGSQTSTNFESVPTGSVTFENGATALSGIPNMPGTLTLNTEGEAYYPDGASNLPPGTYSLSAIYGGDVSYNGSSSGLVALTVAPAITNTTVASAPQGGSDVLTATVVSTSVGLLPTGNVSFFSGTTSLGTSTLTGAYDNNTGFAGGTATLTVTAAQAAGTITALYSGDTNYAGAPYSIVAAANTTSVAAGATATYSLTFDAVNGFSGAVALTCSGAPTAATCTVSPASVTVGGATAATATVSVTTTAESTAAAPIPGSHLPWRWLLLAGLTVPLVLAAKRRRLRLAAVLGLVAMATACGGGSSSGGSTPPPPPFTPAGTYTLAVTAASGTSSSVIPLTLTVTQ